MGKIKTDELEERVGSAGITVNSTVKIDTITEKTSGSGVTIDGLLIKDGVDLTTSNADIVPAVASSTTTIVLTLRCTNVDGTNDATVDVEVVDGTSGAAYIAKTLSVPADTTVELAGTSKLVLETGDKIQGLASAASDVEVFVSYLEIT